MSNVGINLRIPEALEEAVVPRQIRVAESAAELSEICKKISQLFGFSYNCVLRRTDDSAHDTQWSMEIGDWPEGLFDVLATTLTGMSGGKPGSRSAVSWPLCLRVSGEEDDPNVLRLSEAGLKYNLLFRTHHAVGAGGVFCFSGDRHAASEMELASLQFYSILIYDRLLELASGGEGARGNELSPRELECLRWIAKGKTSSEIGIILSLSENTINNYIVNACRKIGAMNRIHAVYISLKAGFIS